MPFSHGSRGRAAALLGPCFILLAGLTHAQGSSDAPETVRSLGAEVWIGAPIVGESPCETLAKRVCGEDRACSELPACREVQQWLSQEQQERAASDNARRMTHASGQCQWADRDRRRYSTCAQ